CDWSPPCTDCRRRRGAPWRAGCGSWRRRWASTSSRRHCFLKSRHHERNRRRGTSVTDHHVADAATTEGLPVAPALAPTLEPIRAPLQLALVTPRVLLISGTAVVTGVAAGLVAQGLTRLIALITNLSFYGTVTVEALSPADNHLGVFVI